MEVKVNVGDVSVVTNTKISVSLEPSEEGVVVKSFADWTNPDLKKCLNEMFHISEGEVITDILVDENGISASIKRKKN